MRIEIEGLDDRLNDWGDISAREEWTGLLVGNGASQVVWPGFRYKSLYNSAVTKGYLDRRSQALFRKLHTHNFEAVLSALNTTQIVMSALGGKRDTSHISERCQGAAQRHFRLQIVDWRLGRLVY